MPYLHEPRKLEGGGSLWLTQGIGVSLGAITGRVAGEGSTCIAPSLGCLISHLLRERMMVVDKGLEKEEKQF